jgi:hypothetical protein
MGYRLDTFLRPFRETDKTIRIFDEMGAPTYAVNPFSVLRLYTANANLNIVLTGKKSIVLDFPDADETSLAMVKLQSYLDQMRLKAPVMIDQATETFVERIIEQSVNIESLNGLTASEQALVVLSGDNIDAVVVSEGSTHSVSIGITGMIPLDKGGTNNSDFEQGELLVSDGGSLVSSGFSVNNSGTSSSDIWTADKIIQAAVSIAKAEVSTSESGGFEKEVVSGQVDGYNCQFKLSKVPIPNSELIFLNGLLQMNGVEHDYIIEDDIITFNDAPLPGMRIICSYRKFAGILG